MTWDGFGAIVTPTLIRLSGTPGDSPILPSSWAYTTKGVQQYPFDPERARQTLEGAGWKPGASGAREKGGQALAFTLLTDNSPARVAVANLLAQQLGAVGCKVTVQAVAPDEATQQVALRQIGPRDVAKLLGGMGACGLESRCCSSFLTEFSPVSIKMAKEQGLSLNPEEITGMQLGNRMVVFEINGSVDIDELARSVFFFALMILPWFQLAREFAQKSMLRAFRINVCPWGRDEDIHGAF